ncbi:hypothetical protein HPP92_020734 [Vanilla planifolia]|uniref:RRM domain-containing protein n=1 Tax=Vanilla planifolia TaxID=51239 RepID=A0A835Q480_VANPL|nr:hypothetical protein HPP92_020734 [Vanilla planifolia]
MRPVFWELRVRYSPFRSGAALSRYGRVDRIDMKSGFAFVYYEDERDAEDAIRALDNAPFGYSKRRLFSRMGDRGRYRDDSRGMANARPTKTLFVINFDPLTTRTRDIERHFEPYGKVLNVRIRRNFAFVQFDSQEEATKALECTNMSKLLTESSRWSMPIEMMVNRETGMTAPGEALVDVVTAHMTALSVQFAEVVQAPTMVRTCSPVYDRYSRPYDRSRSPDYGRYRR